MKKKFQLGVTNGCFDLLHKGHLYSLKQAKRNCNVLIVLLNSNKSTKILKGKGRPVEDQKIRKKKTSPNRICRQSIYLQREDTHKKIKKN